MTNFAAFVAQHKKQLFWTSSVAFVVMLLVALVHYGLIIDGHGLGSDAAQNIRSAANLARSGVYGEGSVDASVEPGSRREPFPNFSLAFYLKF